MRRPRAPLALLAAVLWCGCAAETPAPHPTATLDEILRRAVEAGEVVGVVAMASGIDRPLYRGAFGKQNVAENEEMRIDTIFRIASMTKAITSVAVMQLVEREKLALDDAAADHLPELAQLEVLEGFEGEGGAPLLRPAASPVTVRQLLTHTSGFVYEVWNPAILELVRRGDLTSAAAGDAGFLAAPLVFDPGKRWEYGISTDWLGRLVEEVSGQTLDAYFQEHIFAPLGIVDSHFDLPAAKGPRLVTVQERREDSNLDHQPPALAEVPPEPSPAPVTFYSGGGGLLSTAGDYLRFLRALLAGGSLDGARILDSATVDLMAENHIGELEAGAATTVMPSLSNDFDFFPGSVDTFGLGFLRNGEAVAGGRAAGSLAWAGLYNTYFWIDRERGVCAVLLTQILPFADPAVLDLLDRFERALYAAAASWNSTDRSVE